MEKELFTAPLMVVSLLTPLKMTYETAKKRAEPYTQIVEELPEMRRDTVDLMKKSVGKIRRAYILVNNHSEGNTSMTSQALVSTFQAADT